MEDAINNVKKIKNRKGFLSLFASKPKENNDKEKKEKKGKKEATKDE